jgi:cytochrome bd-type quinol oxidase subunit 1
LPHRPAGTIEARPAGFWSDLWSVALRSLRALPREPELLIPSLIFPVFFFAVNIGTLQDFAQRGIPGLDYRAFQLPTAIIFAAVAIFVIFLGVYGYFVEASVRIGLSVPQVSSVLFAMVSITAIDVFLFRKPKHTGETRWGRMPAISQYVLIFIAVTFTWLMGLMGYVRSGLRQHWHVYGVIRDNSPDAFTPTLGFATQVVSVTVLIFFFLIGFVFWLASLHERKEHPAYAPSPSTPSPVKSGT